MRLLETQLHSHQSFESSLVLRPITLTQIYIVECLSINFSLSLTIFPILAWSKECMNSDNWRAGLRFETKSFGSEITPNVMI